MSEEKVCPLLAQGWLGNKYAAKCTPVDLIETFAINNLPKCIKESCAWWCNDNKRCGRKYE